MDADPSSVGDGEVAGPAGEGATSIAITGAGGVLMQETGMAREGGPDVGSEGQLVLSTGDARVVVEPRTGARVASLRIGGVEILVTGSPDGPLYWGSYPMAPWAGRIRHGRFSFAGRDYQLPLGMPPHAIHGIVRDRPWSVTATGPGSASMEIELDRRWPFRGRVAQRFEVDPSGLTVTLRLEAIDSMPATIGWHPWFRRVIGGPGDPPARLTFEPGEMLVRDADGIPTGERTTPSPGPWDDAFTAIRSNPTIEWPRRIALEIASTCDWWVVYTVPDGALCVEPQSGPPDEANLGPHVLEAGDALERTMRWTWRHLAEHAT